MLPANHNRPNLTCRIIYARIYSKVISLMDALRQSVAQTGKKAGPVHKNGRKKVAQAA